MACIPEADQLPYRGRKGIPTFNIMAACDFDMCFTFVSAGWEGSAHDARVFLHAIETPKMNFPKPPEGMTPPHTQYVCITISYILIILVSFSYKLTIFL